MSSIEDNFPLIGPHEGRELELMLAGKKPLALFFAPSFEVDVLPIENFAPYLEKGTIIGFDEVYLSTYGKLAGLEIRLILYALPEEAWRIEKARKIVLPSILGESPPTEKKDAQLGQLLGYSEEAIKAFNNRTSFAG